MQKGFWNYSEPITYQVLSVTLLPVQKPALHWQNAFAGQRRQILEITSVDGQEVFWIDNEDGTGLSKIQQGGGPGSGHRSVELDSMIEPVLLPDEEINHYSPTKHVETETKIRNWQQTAHPDEFARIERLKAAWAKSDTNPKNLRFSERNR